ESSTQVPEGSGNLNPTASSFNPPADQIETLTVESLIPTVTDQIETLTVESLIPTVSSPVPTACLNNSSEPSSEARLISKRVANQEDTPSSDDLLEFSSMETPNPTVSSSNPPADQMETLTVESPISTVSSPVPTACLNDSQEPSSEARLISKRVANQEETPSLDNILTLTNRFEDILGVTTNSVDSDGVKADVSNMEITITASPTPTLRIHKDHPKSQIIGPVNTPIQTRNKSKEVGEQSFIATIHQKTDLTLLQFCLYSCFLSQVEPKKILKCSSRPKLGRSYVGRASSIQ
nr:hypothetical protein [Tanacetum cinerariifolium]